MSIWITRHVRYWHEEVLAERIVTFAGPDVAVVRVRPRPDVDEPGVGQKVWRATVLSADLRRIPVNKAVSQILAQLIRDRYRDKDWSKPWDYASVVNEAHLRLCASPEWARFVEDDLLPWVLATHDLGDDVLEIGPGPGLTTDVLRGKVARLTAVEVDQALAGALADRLAGTNVEVVCGDATALTFPDERFSAVTCFTVLHHVPSVDLQDRLLREVHRVLRSGGLFVGTDGLDTPERRTLHEDDIFVPVDPHTLGRRLASAGFAEPVIEARGDRFRFRAIA